MLKYNDRFDPKKERNIRWKIQWSFLSPIIGSIYIKLHVACMVTLPLVFEDHKHVCQKIYIFQGKYGRCFEICLGIKYL